MHQRYLPIASILLALIVLPWQNLRADIECGDGCVSQSEDGTLGVSLGVGTYDSIDPAGTAHQYDEPITIAQPSASDWIVNIGDECAYNYTSTPPVNPMDGELCPDIGAASPIGVSATTSMSFYITFALQCNLEPECGTQSRLNMMLAVDGVPQDYVANVAEAGSVYTNGTTIYRTMLVTTLVEFPSSGEHYISVHKVGFSDTTPEFRNGTNHGFCTSCGIIGRVVVP